MEKKDMDNRDFEIKIKSSNNLSQEEKRKALWAVFDTLLSNNSGGRKKNQKIQTIPQVKSKTNNL